MREIINKSDPVAIPLMCGHPHRAMDITVDKLEVSGSSRSGGRERVSMHLASFAGFIYCIRVCLRIKLDSCDQVRLPGNNLLDACLPSESGRGNDARSGDPMGGWWQMKGKQTFQQKWCLPQGRQQCKLQFCLKGNPVIFDEVHGVRLNGDSEMAMHGNI